MSLFIDAASRVDREGLTYVLHEMQQYRKVAESVCITRRDFWERLKTVAASNFYDDELHRVVKVIDQLMHLPDFISVWVSTALDSEERFNFFVLTKAHELASGDQQKDYYWALQIRHDQLVALVRVVEMVLNKMKIWLALRPAQVFGDPVFSGLVSYDLEQQIYLEAERIYKERGTMTHVSDS